MLPFLFFISLDLEAKERVMEDMRLALTEQEETQSQMEEVLEEKLQLIQELSSGETQDLKLKKLKKRVKLEAKQTMWKEFRFHSFVTSGSFQL